MSQLPSKHEMEVQERELQSIERELEMGTENRPKQNRKVHESTQAAVLIELANDVELFHTPDGEGYATFAVGDHKETWALKSRSFKDFLLHRFYRDNGKPPGNQALVDATAQLQAKARYDGKEHLVFTRIAERDGRIYLDLANDRWEAVEIDGEDWHIISDPPVKFRRPKGLLPLSRPVEGGSIDDLRPFVNVKSEGDWKLIVAWLVACMRPTGPFPILVLQGVQGSCKSTLMRLLCKLIDPNKPDLRTMPHNERDLVISAGNRHILAFDNVSAIPPWLSDALCRISTGGGFGTRKLYEDDEEALFDVKRPTALNGIEELIYRGDLLERSIPITLQPPPKRRDEKSLLHDFDLARPSILGALLTAVCGALRNLHQVKPPSLPRMADFAIWAISAETGLGWTPGTFLKSYNANQNDAIKTGLGLDGFALSIIRLADRGEWEGTATALEEALKEIATDDTRRLRSWPKGPRSVSNRLKRIVPGLKAIGIEVCMGDENREGGTGERLITIRKVTENSVTNVTASQPSDARDECDDETRHFSNPGGVDGGVDLAKLYPHIEKEVITPRGPGRLLQVLPDRVGVVLNNDHDKVTFFRPDEIETGSEGVGDIYE